jgi:hypothetical protein
MSCLLHLTSDRFTKPSLIFDFKPPMREYDGVEYQYSSTHQQEAIGIIANILGFKPLARDLDFKLNFYASGSGVDDGLAIRCQYGKADWPAIAQTLRLKNVKEIPGNPDWHEAFLGLLDTEGAAGVPEQHLFQFINQHRHTFQDAADAGWEIFFSNESDVNSWCVVWRSPSHLNYLSFDQG